MADTKSSGPQEICGLSSRQWGVMVAVVGIVWASPDSLCIRLASEEQPGSGCVLFYRYCFKAAATSLGLILACGGPRGLVKSCMATGWHFIAASLLDGLAEAMFTLSIQTTAVANTLVLFNASPLWCAILGCIAFGERPPLHTLAALLLGFTCVLVVFFGARVEGTPSGKESSFGDALGLIGGFVLALYLTVCRHAGMKHPEANLVPAIMASSVISATIALVYSRGKIGEHCWPESGVTGWAYVATNGGVLMPIAFACLSTAPKYILSAEVAMIMLLEVLLGPLLVWVVLGEAPSLVTVIAGAGLVTLLGMHELYASRLTSRRQSRANEEVVKPVQDSDGAANDSMPPTRLGCNDSSPSENGSDDPSISPRSDALCEALSEAEMNKPDSATQSIASSLPVVLTM